MDQQIDYYYSPSIWIFLLLSLSVILSFTPRIDLLLEHPIMKKTELSSAIYVSNSLLSQYVVSIYKLTALFRLVQDGCHVRPFVRVTQQVQKSDFMHSELKLLSTPFRTNLNHSTLLSRLNK